MKKPLGYLQNATELQSVRVDLKVLEMVMFALACYNTQH